MSKEEGMLLSEVEGKDGKKFVIISVYNSGEILKLEKEIRRTMEERREEYVIIGGDFNIRIGEEGGVDEAGGDLGRKSKDKIIGNGGRRLMELVGETGGYILNGTAKGDKEGEFTYIGPRGSTVIDYVIVNETCNEFVQEFKVVERIDSDHLPLVLELDVSLEDKAEEGKEDGEDKSERRTRICWDEEACMMYKENTEGESWAEATERLKTEEKWEKLKNIIDKALVRKEIRTRKIELGERRWWDKSCTRGKRKLKRMLGKWKKGKEDINFYWEERKKWKDML